MNTTCRPVTLQKIPGLMSKLQGNAFVASLKCKSPSERPRIVLDCSQLSSLDDQTIHVLLQCLEEGMKRNGDVRLAGLAPSVRNTMSRVGLTQLFEIFETAAAAIESYVSPFSTPVPAMADLQWAEGNAA